MNSTVFGMLQGWEIVGIIVLALVLFGAKKLPELAKGLGQGIREFKKASRDVTDEFQNVMDDDATPTPPRKLKDKDKETSGVASEKPPEAVARTESGTSDSDSPKS
jgi:sec-independent protein translocase protein TatA